MPRKKIMSCEKCVEYVLANDLKAVMNHINSGGEYFHANTSPPLRTACCTGNEGIMRFIIESGVTSTHRCRAVYDAAYHGHLRLVKIIVDKYKTDVSNLDVMHAMIYLGREEIALFLLARGAPLDENYLPLVMCIDNKLWRILDVLIERGRHFNEHDSSCINEFISDRPMSPKKIRYFVMFGGWIVGLNPHDYAFEITQTKHGHHPELAEYLSRKRWVPLRGVFTDIDVMTH